MVSARVPSRFKRTITQECLNRPRDVDWRFRTSLRPQSALWLVVNLPKFNTILSGKQPRQMTEWPSVSRIISILVIRELTTSEICPLRDIPADITAGGGIETGFALN